METRDVVVVGAGPAGLTAGIFTARADLDTLVVSDGESILRRNAHLENVPGFPAGVNARTFLDMTAEQAESAGCDRLDAAVTRVREADLGFVVETDANGGDTAEIRADFVVLASKNDTDPVADLDGVGVVTRGSKTYVECDEHGRTGVDGLYAAGRVAERYHQTVVAAGSGAETALTLVDDSDVPYYHDWVAPAGYFTGRDRDVPPGCEEIGAEERLARERESIAAMREWFDEPHPADPTPHPSQE